MWFYTVMLTLILCILAVEDKSAVQFGPWSCNVDDFQATFAGKL